MIAQELKKGETCQAYSTTNETKSYGNCVEQELKREMKRMFGCLPPWIPVSDNQDKCPLVIKDFYKAGPSDIPHNVFNLVDNQRILDFCKPPC